MFLQKYNTGISFGIFKKEIQAWWVKILFFCPPTQRADGQSGEIRFCVGVFCVGVLDSFDLLGDWNWAKTFSNWFEKWIENNFKNDRPEFSNTSHFNLVRSFKRRIEPNVCASDKSFSSVFTPFYPIFDQLPVFLSIFGPFPVHFWSVFGEVLVDFRSIIDLISVGFWPMMGFGKKSSNLDS